MGDTVLLNDIVLFGWINLHKTCEKDALTKEGRTFNSKCNLKYTLKMMTCNFISCRVCDVVCLCG